MDFPNPGIYQIPADDYFSVQAASNSGLKLIAKSPAHFLYNWQHPDDGNTPDRDFRRAFHAAILEPNNFDAQFVVLPEDAPNKPTSRQINAKKPSSDTLYAIDYWAQFARENAGKTIIKSDRRDQILSMQASIFAHPEARELLSGGAGEQSVFWIDEETGAQCRSRLDYLGADYIADLKSGPADRDGFAMIARRLSYDCQDAMYEDGTRAVGRQVNGFYFVVCEEDPPYCCAVHTLTPESVTRGREIYRRHLATYAWCESTGSWPGYPVDQRPVEIRRWVESEEE